MLKKSLAKSQKVERKNVFMNFVKPQRQRWELLILLLLGVTCGSYLSRLLQPARHESYNSASTAVADDAFNSGRSVSVSSTPDTLLRHADEQPYSILTQRILCILTVRPKVKPHIESTWGRRCHKLLFLSDQRKEESQFRNLLKRRHSNNISSTWSRTREHLNYVYTHYKGQYDWVLMIADECYIIMENLQRFLSDYAPEMPIYFESLTSDSSEKHLVHGSAGYIFSAEALRRFVTVAHGNSRICSDHNYGIKHVEIARCLRNVGVAAGHSFDAEGLPRFVNKLSNITEGCCSKTAISFPCPNSSCFYVLEYLVYTLRPFG